MTLLIIAPDIKVTSWVKYLGTLEPGIEIRVWPEVGAGIIRWVSFQNIKT
jgi:hypothetical protein